MVVIPTYNGGKELLKGILSDLAKFNVPNNEICIVDNGSIDQSHLRELEDIKYNGINVLINPNPGYELGAYKLAINTFKADVWFCIQDSIRIKQNIFQDIPPLLTNKNVYTFLFWSNMEYVYVPEIYKFLFESYGRIVYNMALYGNMFFARDEVVRLVMNDWVIPKNKWESVSNEMGLGIVFEKYGIEIVGLDACDEHVDVANGFDHYPFFTKIAKLRQ